jgi:hypothetical protein
MNLNRIIKFRIFGSEEIKNMMQLQDYKKIFGTEKRPVSIIAKNSLCNRYY